MPHGQYFSLARARRSPGGHGVVSARSRLAARLFAYAFVTSCSGRSIVANEGRDGATDAGLSDIGVDAPRVPGGASFDPRVHGFSFANYDNSDAASNLTAAQMRRLFGPDVCEPSGGAACVLTPVAANWMRDTNDLMDVGHCEGMAVLSTLLQQNVIPLSSVQPGAMSTFALTRSPALEQELALWWATQVVPTLNDEECGPATDTLQRLERSFQAGSGEAWTLAMWTLVGDAYEGGHAVTPIGVERADGSVDQADVLIYDNNFPGETRRIRYTSLATGAWTYRTSLNPDAAVSDYTGNDAGNPLCLRRVNARLAQPSGCYFCGEYQSPSADVAGHQLRAPSNPMSLPMPGVLGRGARGASISSNTNRRTGALRAILTDGLGRSLNNLRGSADAGMSEGRVIRLTSIDPGSVRVAPVFSFHEGAAVRLTLRNESADPSAMEPLDAHFFGPGYTLAVEGIDLPPGQSDYLALAPTGVGMVYQTSRDDSAAVVVGATVTGDDWRFTVRTRGHAGGETIGVALDTARQELDFYFVGAASEMHTFDLVVQRVNAQGTQTFGHTGTAEPAGTMLHLRYGAWSGDGHEIPLAVDRNDDGAPESMEMLSDMEVTADAGH